MRDFLACLRLKTHDTTRKCRGEKEGVRNDVRSINGKSLIEK